MKRTKAQRRWVRKGYTHEATYWSGLGKPWNFILVIRADTAKYLRKTRLDDDWIRPIAPQFIHKGGKP